MKDLKKANEDSGEPSMLQVIRDEAGAPLYAVLPWDTYQDLAHWAGEAAKAEREDAMDAAHAARLRARIDAGEEELFPSELIEAMDAGENPIRVFRKHRALTQVALAAKAGIEQSYLSALETGAKTPSAKTLRELARVLGVDMEILLPDDDEPPGDE